MTLFPDDGTFWEARQPWMPTLSDILFRQEHADTQAARDYYSRFGLSAAVWDSSLTDLNAHKDEIIALFNERFLFRMINRETLEQWQIRLQTILDTEGPRTDRALRLYRLADINSVVEIETVTYNAVKDQLSGSDTSTGAVTDTPDAVTNAADLYADKRTKSSQSFGRASTRTGSVETAHIPGGGILKDVDGSIDAYRNLIADFVEKFGKIFLSVHWY